MFIFRYLWCSEYRRIKIIWPQLDWISGTLEHTCPQVEKTSASFCSVTCKSKGSTDQEKIKLNIPKHDSSFSRIYMLINVRDVDCPPHTVLSISPSGPASHPPPPLVEAVPSLISIRRAKSICRPTTRTTRINKFFWQKPESINEHRITPFCSEILKG